MFPVNHPVSFQRPTKNGKKTEDLIGLYAGQEGGRIIVTHLATCCEGSFTPDSIREERFVVPEDIEVYSLSLVDTDHWVKTWELRKSEKPIGLWSAITTAILILPPIIGVLIWPDIHGFERHALPFLKFQFSIVALVVVGIMAWTMYDQRRSKSR